MKNTTYLTDEDRWQAVLVRDPRADNQFVFAVQTTGIYCRPSCRARHALRKMSAFILMLTVPRRRVSAPVSAVGRTSRPYGAEKANIALACRLLEQDAALNPRHWRSRLP